MYPQTNLQVLDGGLFKYIRPFVTIWNEGLREQNICETKNCEIKVFEPDFGN